MICISGDIHGHLSARRLNNDNVRLACGGDFPSHVIILGDFGLVWAAVGSADDKTDKYWRDWLDEKPWITLSTIGNHENYERIYQLPLVDLYGGKAYKVSDRIYFLQHGHVFTIEGKTFFNFGGALSIDKEQRVNRISWWEEEIPTRADWARGNESLEKVKNTVDYVITHTAPKEAIKVIKHRLPFYETDYFDLKMVDPTVPMLDAFIEQGLTFKTHFFGHFHLEKDFNVGGRNYSAMYESLKTI